MATFKTRICNKIDTYQNWIDSKLVPLAGEICIVTVPAETGAVQQEPATLIKVGDGTTEFSLLPWLSGKAADVYDWAKAENKPIYEAKEITGIDTYIADYVESEMGISVDTDTQYTIVPVDGNAYKFKLMSKSKLDEEFTVEVASFEIPEFDHAEMDQAIADNTAAIELLNGDAETAGSVAKAIADAIAALKLDETYEKVGVAAEEAGKVQDALDAYIGTNDVAVAAAKKAGDDAQADVDALAGKVGEVPADKTVVQMIADAQTAATYDDTELVGRVAAIEGDYLVEADKTELQGKIDLKADQTALDSVSGRVTTAEGTLATLTANAETAGSVDYKIAQAVAAIMENPDETMNSINELVTWCNDHADDALELSNQVIANRDNLADLAEFVGELPEGAVSTTVVGYIGEAIAALSIGDYAKASDLEAAIGRIVTLEGKVAAIEGDYLKGSDKTELEGKITAAQSAAEKVATDFNTAMDARVKAVEDDYLTSADKNELAGDIADVDAKFASYSTTEQMNAAIGVEAERAAAAEKQLSERIDALDEIDHDAYVAADEQVLADAKAYTDELEGELHAVAKSGDIAALAQAEDTYVIFDCGSATKVI